MGNFKKVVREIKEKIDIMNARLINGQQSPSQPPTEHSSALKIPTIYERVDALENALLEVATMVAEAQND